MSTADERAAFEQLRSYTFPGLLDRWGIHSLGLLGKGVYGSCYASECGVVKHIELPPVTSHSGKYFSPSVRHRLLLYELEILEFITSILRDGRDLRSPRCGEQLLSSASSSSLCDDVDFDFENVEESVGDPRRTPDQLLCDKWNLMGLRGIIPPRSEELFRLHGVYFIMERQFPCSLRQHIRARRARDLELYKVARFARMVPSKSVQRLNTPQLISSGLSPIKGSDARGVGAMGEGEVRVIVWEVLRGLRALHHLGICHLDVKPSNILVDPKGIRNARKRSKKRKKQPQQEEEQQSSVTSSVCLTDFGLSMPIGCPLSSAYSRVVSSWYRPPEICKRIAIDVPGRKSDGPLYDGKADIWGTACIMAELLTGKALFRRSRNLEVYVAQKAFLRAPRAHLQRVARCCGVAHFGEVALDLLVGMLKADPEERLSAAEAMAHPFFDEMRRRRQKRQQEETLSPEVSVNITAVAGTTGTTETKGTVEQQQQQEVTPLPTMTKFQDVHPEARKQLPRCPQWTERTVLRLREKIFEFVHKRERERERNEEEERECCVVG